MRRARRRRLSARVAPHGMEAQGHLCSFASIVSTVLACAAIVSVRSLAPLAATAATQRATCNRARATRSPQRCDRDAATTRRRRGGAPSTSTSSCCVRCTSTLTMSSSSCSQRWLSMAACSYRGEATRCGPAAWQRNTARRMEAVRRRGLILQRCLAPRLVAQRRFELRHPPRRLRKSSVHFPTILWSRYGNPPCPYAHTPLPPRAAAPAPTAARKARLKPALDHSSAASARPRSAPAQDAGAPRERARRRCAPARCGRPRPRRRPPAQTDRPQ